MHTHTYTCLLYTNTHENEKQNKKINSIFCIQVISFSFLGSWLMSCSKEDIGVERARACLWPHRWEKKELGLERPNSQVGRVLVVKTFPGKVMAVGKTICYASVRTRVQFINIRVKQNKRKNQTRGSVHRYLQHWKMETGTLISFLGGYS